MKNILTLSILFALFIGFSLNSNANIIINDDLTTSISEYSTSVDIFDNDKDKDKDKKNKKAAKHDRKKSNGDKKTKCDNKDYSKVKHHPKKGCGGCNHKTPCKGHEH